MPGSRTGPDRSRRRDDLRGGGVAVEFALIAPILILLMVGAADFGFAMYEQMRISNAARAGAQYAVLDTNNARDTTGITNSVALAAEKDTSEVTVVSEMTCKCEDGRATSCSGVCGVNTPPEVYVEVNVTYQHPTFVSYMVIPDTITLTGTSKFRLR